MLFARMAGHDLLDTMATVAFVALSLGLPALGYTLMVLDVRAYLRAVRGALVVLHKYAVEVPPWACRQGSASLRALGLQYPCTEKNVREAYRRLAEQYHPDRGGDRTRFLRLHEHFERAIQVVRSKVQP